MDRARAGVAGSITNTTTINAGYATTAREYNFCQGKDSIVTIECRLNSEERREVEERSKSSRIYYRNMNFRGRDQKSADDLAADQCLREEKANSEKHKRKEEEARAKEEDDDDRDTKRQAKKPGQVEKKKEEERKELKQRSDAAAAALLEAKEEMRKQQQKINY